MFDEEEANVTLPYDDPTSPVPIEVDEENGTSLGDLRLRIAPPTKVYKLEDSTVVKGNLGKLKGVSQGINIEPEDDDMDLELGYRQNALLLQGEPISHLPTDQVFAYVTSYAPVPIGLEWVDDTTCVVLFSSSTVARAARRFLLADSPAEGDPMPDPLELLPAKLVLEEAWPEKARVAEADDIRTALQGQVFVRQAKLNDVKQRDARERSRFYSTYGTRAGKEGYGERKRRREDDEEEMAPEKRRALDDELDAYLADEPSERDRRKRAGLDEQLDAYLVSDNLPNGYSESNGERRIPRPRRERRDPPTREERAARRQQALDAQLDDYVEKDDVQTMPSRMRSDWTEEAREREYSPDRQGGRDGFGRRRANRYEDAPPVARPMREAERWKRNGDVGEVVDDGERRRGRRDRSGRGPRRNGGLGDAPAEGGRRSNPRLRKNQDELDAELEAYLNSSTA